jgi:hypothetical protein
MGSTRAMMDKSEYKCWFLWPNGRVSAGVVIRGEPGKVLLTAWQLLRRCAMVEEAEAEACLRGPKLTTEWSGIMAIIERKRVDDHGLERERNGMGGGA